jgi:hypothetical protein
VVAILTSMMPCAVTWRNSSRFLETGLKASDRFLSIPHHSTNTVFPNYCAFELARLWVFDFVAVFLTHINLVFRNIRGCSTDSDSPDQTCRSFCRSDFFLGRWVSVTFLTSTFVPQIVCHGFIRR